MKSPLKIILFSALGVTALGIALTFPITRITSFAQTTSPNEVIFTWEAWNFFPSDFRGKALPTDGSQVIVSVAFLKNAAFVPLNTATVKWYVDNKLTSRGVGLTTFSFTATKLGGDFHIVRAIVEPAGGASVESAVKIPIGTRRVVLRGVSSLKPSSPGTQLIVEAFPYFFNIASLSELTFYWSVNGKREYGVNGNAIALIAPVSDTQTSVTVSVTAQSNRDPLDYGTGKIQTVIQ